MKAEMRTRIYEMLHRVYEKQKVLEIIRWALEADENIQLPEDFALGYMIGAVTNIASQFIVEEKSRKRLAKVAEEILKPSDNAKPIDGSAPKVIYMQADTTDKEAEEIRNMIIPMIPQFRAKISQELALRNSR